MTTTHKQILKSIAKLDPVAYDGGDGGEQICFFCEADVRYFSDLGDEAIFHKQGCLWRLANIWSFNSQHHKLDPKHRWEGQEPGPIHGPPIPDELLPPLHRILKHYTEQLLRDRYERPLLIEKILQDGHKDDVVRFNVSRSTKFD